jgi:hypothetical protein
MMKLAISFAEKLNKLIEEEISEWEFEGEATQEIVEVLRDKLADLRQLQAGFAD